MWAAKPQSSFALTAFLFAAKRSYLYLLWRRSVNSLGKKNFSLCYISQKRSGIRGYRDFNLGEPERKYNICLDFYLRLKMLIMLYIPEALRHTRMPGLQPGWTRKDIQHLPGFSFTFQNADFVVYPRSAQAYADAGTSTWVNQKGYTTLPGFSFTFQNADYGYPRSAQAYADAGTSTWVNQKGYTTFAWIFICVLNADYVIYPRSAQAYADAGTSTWVNQKGYTTFAWIFIYVSKCWLCCISQKRSGIRGCRDFNLGEPERVYNICLDFHLRLKCWLCYISQKRSGIRGCRDFNLGEPERIYNICLDFYLRLKMLIVLNTQRRSGINSYRQV